MKFSLLEFEKEIKANEDVDYFRKYLDGHIDRCAQISRWNLKFFGRTMCIE
jgi:hypothetical protein